MMNQPAPRLLVMDNPTAWRQYQWAEFVDHLVLTTEGVFTIRREGPLIYRRPAHAADFERIFGLTVQDKLFRSAVELQVRVPYQLLMRAISFFRYVWQQQQREDVLLLYYYDQKKRYQLVHPPLVSASPQHVDYDLPATPADAVRFGSIHSHGRNSAYHSYQDEKDDRHSPGIHVVVGHLDLPQPSVLCVASDGTNCFAVPLWDVFTQPTPISFPHCWYINMPSPKRSTEYDISL